MKKPWSLSTTIRNPERILPFLRTLAEMEGEDFDEKGQIKFQTLLIKNRLYRPMNLPEDLSLYYESKEDSMSYNQAQEIFNFMLSQSSTLPDSPGIRGRTSASPLTQKGLAIAKQSQGPVKITQLGKDFLKNADIGEAFLSYFVKWQIPNPLEDYSLEDGYNIKPFLATLTVIKNVNERMEAMGKKPKGISKKEFSLFIPTLISHLDIEETVNNIVNLRTQLEGKSRSEQRELFSQYKHSFLKDWLETEDADEIGRNINNLKDYGDSILRNFKLTRYLYIRGRGYYVDIEPRRLIEITELISTLGLEPTEFETEEEYIAYISDTSSPTLPWNNLDDLSNMIVSLADEINIYKNELLLETSAVPTPHTVQEAKELVENLKNQRRELQEKLNHVKSQKVESVEEYIDSLSNIYDMEDKSLMLEKYSALSLHSLNDALNIKPNYSVGDDNEPIFTAPAGTPDIECYYSSFNAICEVTMLKSRDQWYNEGQPVMRHLRDFEDKNPEKDSYCIFIAPKVHRDTLNTFWTSIKYEYEGKAQKIVPITISDFTRIMEILLRIKESGNSFSHHSLKSLYDSILENVQTTSNSEDWLATIPNIINSWEEEIS